MSDENDAGAAYLAALRQSGGPQAASAAPARAPDAPHSGEPKLDDPKLEKPGLDNARIDKLRPSEARLANAVPASGVAPASPEKRKSPRYKLNGTARLQECGSAAATWATFCDISMHGCYVESTAPSCTGTLLELKLEANGFHIEARGEVRVTYPGLGMGISFTKVSDEDRERMRELMRSISRPSVILSSQAAERSHSMSPSDTPPITNPTIALQAMLKFFEDRHMMGREEFLRILRKSQ